MLDLVFNHFTTDRIYGGEFFEEVVGVVVKELGLDSKKIELSVNLVGEGRIKALNKKYRGRNRVTDVLSFPLISGHRKTRDLNHRSTEKPENRNLILGYRKSKGLAISPNFQTSGIMNLGDIFICLPVAKKYARRENVGLDYKLALLTIHGFLHLLGYDHEETSEREVMFKLQDKILQKLNP